MSCTITGEPNCRCEYEMEPVELPNRKETLRKLFTDHANYTNLFLISEMNDLELKNDIVSRLMENQEDIAEIMTIRIGRNASNKLADLLKEHIKLAGNVAEKYIQFMDGEISKYDLDKNIELLFENSTKVSKLIASVDPNILPYNEIKLHFDEHNRYVIELAKLHYESVFESNIGKEIIKKYDCYYNHMIMFSDLLWLLIK